MTMRIVFQKDYDGYKKDQDCYVDRTLARRFCEKGVAITYSQYQNNLYETERAIKEAKEKSKAKVLADAREAADAKKAKLVAEAEAKPKSKKKK